MTRAELQYIYHIDLGINMNVPDMLQDHGFGDDPPGMTQQVCE